MQYAVFASPRTIFLAFLFSSLASWADDTNSDAGEVIPVTTERLGALVLYPSSSAPATAISLNDARIGAEISGQIDTVFKKVGETVSKDDLLAHIKCDDYEIAVTEAKAAQDVGQAKYVFEKAQLDKARVLSKNQTISSEELDRRTANFRVAGAEVDRLAAALRAAERSAEKCSVRAPFNAVVIERAANVGDYVVPGHPVARILDQDNIEVVAHVQEQDLDSLKEAAELLFVGRHANFPLQLRTVLPIVESKIRSHEVRLTFRGKKPVPGSAGRLQWRSSKAHLPANLLVRRSDLGIFIVDDNKAKFLPLKGAKEGQPAAVNVDDSLNVVIKGRFRLSDGADVIVVNQ